MTNPETQLVTDPARTKLVKPPKTYKLEMVRDFEVKDVTGEKLVRVPGAIVEVDEAEARRVLSVKWDGPYAFSGERSDKDAQRHKVQMARLYKGPEQASSTPKTIEEEFA